MDLVVDTGISSSVITACERPLSKRCSIVFLQWEEIPQAWKSLRLFYNPWNSRPENQNDPIKMTPSLSPRARVPFAIAQAAFALQVKCTINFSQGLCPVCVFLWKVQLCPFTQGNLGEDEEMSGEV